MVDPVRLRDATEDDVEAALENCYVALPLRTKVDALEFFNCMVTHLLGPIDD